MVRIESGIPGEIKVTFPYSPTAVASVKSIYGSRRHPDGKYWTLPHSDAMIDRLLLIFRGAKVEIDARLRPLPEPPTASPLLDQMRESIRLKHYSVRTEKGYVHWIERYMRYYRGRDLKELGSGEIEAFLTHLAVDHEVSASTQNQAFNALLFLYRNVLRKEVGESINAVRAKQPTRLPTVMTKEETMQVINAISPDRQLMVKLIYGSGLRLMECLRLRVKDVDFANCQLLIRDGKGMKDRVTVLPDNLLVSLKEHLERVRLLHEDDLSKGYGSVYLPYALERKYPTAAKEFGWQYVFPAKGLSKDPRSGKIRRHHLSENIVQKAVKEAVRLVGIRKPISVHAFRHSFATHLL